MRAQNTFSPHTNVIFDSIKFFILICFLLICLFGGGGSRADIVSLLYLRPASVICIALLLALPGQFHFRKVGLPLILLACLALTMLVQLLPLPPWLWTELPGHGRFAEAAIAADMAQPWRPISISPDLTLNSLASLLIPLAVLIGIASISRERVLSLLPFLIIAVLASAILGLVQLTGGPGNSFYLYRITNPTSAVGFFANRNHQAVLLAVAFPMLALWATLPGKTDAQSNARKWMAGTLALFLVPMILVTGSRAGLVLGALGLILAFIQYGRQLILGDLKHRKYTYLLRIAPLVLGIMVILLTIFLSRAEAIHRLLETSNYEDRRLENLPLLVQITRDFMPFGSGFGSFDPVFRIYEPMSGLRLVYLNHAHNDLVEIALTGGVASLVILVIFIAWWIRKSLPLFFASAKLSRQVRFGRLGTIIIGMLLLASIVDYPLRTPIMQALFAIACGWLCYASTASGREHRFGGKEAVR